MKVSEHIYNNTVLALASGTRRIIHQGGQWSGKTVNILAALATVIQNEDGETDVTTVTSMSFPHLKGGALRDFESYVYPHFKHAIKSYNRTDHIFTFHSGAKLEFKVYENEEKAKGAKRKRLFINEANTFPYLVFFQLDSRSEQTIIDYNPSVAFWAHDELIGQSGNKTFISDHRQNPFLTAARHREIESIRDKELWKVYARGVTGNVSGVIFPDWKMIDEDEFPVNQEWIWSIDYGYTVDPTAIMKMCKIGNSLFVKELCYEPGLGKMEIKNILLANGYRTGGSDILYSEHDGDMIKNLRNAGLTVLPARKGQGSVNAGITMLKKDFNGVFYSSNSQNLHRERSRYVWETDKKSGKMLNVPVDNNNHCFDAIRYGVYSKFLRTAA